MEIPFWLDLLFTVIVFPFLNLLFLMGFVTSEKNKHKTLLGLLFGGAGVLLSSLYVALNLYTAHIFGLIHFLLGVLVGVFVFCKKDLNIVRKIVASYIFGLVFLPISIIIFLILAIVWAVLVEFTDIENIKVVDILLGGSKWQNVIYFFFLITTPIVALVEFVGEKRK